MPPREPSDPNLMTVFSEKCAEHGYLVQTVRETRDTQLAEVAEARSWRAATTEKLYGMSAAIQSHLERHSAKDEMEAEQTGKIRERDETEHRRHMAWAKCAIGLISAIGAAGAALGISAFFGG